MEKYKKIIGWIPAVSFLFFSLSAAAQAQNGTLKGSVVNGLNEPLAGQWVDVFDCITNNPDYHNGYVTSVKTLSNGSFQKDLPAGGYRIAVLLDSAYLDEWYDDQQSPGLAECVQVAAEEIKTLDHNIQLESAVTGSISGTVTNSDGIIAVQGVVVYAYNSDGSWQSSTTDSNGQYKISGLHTGYYPVYFGAFNTEYVSLWYDNKLSSGQATQVSVSAPDDTPNINAQLYIGGTVSGKVTDSKTGAPIQNAWIDVYDKNLDVSGHSVWRGYATSATDGSYLVKGLPRGEHKIEVFKAYETEPKEWYKNRSSFSSATPVPVNAGEETSGIDIALGPEPPTDLSQVYKLLLLKKRCTIVNGVRVCR